ncbi:hypothetical protein C0993_004117, partial [Termitomyces sp. T159_Od127]
MNEEGILHQIRNAPRDTFFTQHNLQTTPANKVDNDRPFTLSPDNRLLLRDGRIYAPDHQKIRLDILCQHHNHKLRGHPRI